MNNPRHHGPEAASPAAPLRLLMVDDDTNDLDICERDLKKSGMLFSAARVSTRSEFEQKLREEPFDVVISDYRMKDWTGIDALALLREIRPDVPFILLSGTLGEELAVECIKLGVTDYVLKNQRARLPVAIRRAEEERILREAEVKSARELRESEAHYRSLVDNAPYGIYWVNPEGDFLFVNPALVQMLGYASAEELLAVKSTSSFYTDSSLRDQLFARYLETGRVDSTVEWQRKDGKKIIVRIDARRAQVPGQASECIQVTVEDITERTVLEKQLREAQKFEAIGQLAGGIAHDFNNMIGAIMGWADIGADETEPGSRLRRHFEKMRHQAQRAAALTRQLLAFARRQILEPRDIDLNQSVMETLSLLEKIIGSNIEIKANLIPDLAVVRADPTQVQQVLMNLCINARDAMPAGGTLLIQTGNVSFDQKCCAAKPFAHPGDYAMVSVADNGTGMDAATLGRIFEPFFTTKEIGKGTGLGLATVYGVARQHGGFVDVESEVGKGSTFRTYFPISATASVTREKPDDSAAVLGGSETILVAEDHDGLRQLAYEVLSRLGYCVLLATDGHQALREFDDHEKDIGLGILDVMLPKLGGPEVYARISQKNPRLPVIFTTGYSADIEMLKRVQEHGLPVLLKPYGPRVLARKVREILDQRIRTVAVK